MFKFVSFETDVSRANLFESNLTLTGILPGQILNGISWKSQESSIKDLMNAITMCFINSSEVPINIFDVSFLPDSANVATLLLEDDLDAYRYLKSSRKSVQGIDDISDFTTLKVSLSSQPFTNLEIPTNHGHR